MFRHTLAPLLAPSSVALVGATEREGALGDRFGTATPQEALTSHRVFQAALDSHRSGCAERL